MSALALIEKPSDRISVSYKRELMRRLDGADVREAEIRRVMEEGVWKQSRSHLIRLHDSWRKAGENALVDKRRVPAKRACNTWLQVYMTYAEDDQRTSYGGWRRMLADFRAGMGTDKGMPDWRVVYAQDRKGRRVPTHCPMEWVPKGASYSTLQRAANRQAEYRFALAATRTGMKAASPFVRPVLRTRLGLKVGQVYEWDDKWHDVESVLDGDAVRALEFCGYDVSSANKIAYSVRPRVRKTDGHRDSLKEREFRWLFAHVLTNVGFHKDGMWSVVEMGMTAIRPKHEERIKAIPKWGDLLHFERSGSLAEQVHAGMHRGDGGGNFRMKALCEGAHRRDHDGLAYLIGQVGKDPVHRPESHAALVKYSTAMAQAAARLPERTRALIDLEMLTWDQYQAAYLQIMEGLAWDPDHALEGWDPETRRVVEWRTSESSNDWHSVDELLTLSTEERTAMRVFFKLHPECSRSRAMSRREAWNAGQDELVRVPLNEMFMLMMEEDARPATVQNDGTIVFRDTYYFGRDDMIYHAQIETRQGYRHALAPGTKVMLLATPFHTEHVWLSDPESGKPMGMAPLYMKAPHYDKAAIKRAMGAKNADLARKVLPIRGRHQAAAETRARLMGRNADVLAGRLTPDSTVDDDSCDVPAAIDRMAEAYEECELMEI